MGTQWACLDGPCDQKSHDHQETDGEFSDDPSRRSKRCPRKNRSEEAFTTNNSSTSTPSSGSAKIPIKPKNNPRIAPRNPADCSSARCSEALARPPAKSSLYLLKLGQGVQSAALGFGSSFSTFGIARPFSIYCRASAVRPICA